MFRHIGMYFNVAVNIFVTTAVLSIFTKNDAMALGITLLVMAGCIGISFSPVGIRLLRLQCNLRDPNEIEKSRIDLIFQRVYRKAQEKSPGLPKDIVWYMRDDDSINAVAVGLHTIGINVGAIKYCRNDEIAAMLAHEFGHIAHRDALATNLVIQSNFLALLCKNIAMLILKILGAGLTFLFAFVSESGAMGTIFELLTKFVNWIFNIYMSVIFTICTMISYASCRKQEYAADRYAAELGFKDPLIQVFKILPTTSKLSLSADIVQMLYSTHPKTEDRIQRLSAAGQLSSMRQRRNNA